MIKKAFTVLTAAFVLLATVQTSMAVTIFSSFKNNTYTFGRDSDVFIMNITDSNLNTSSVVHHIRVYEAISDWYNTTANCFSAGSYWSCNNTVTGFGSLASDGKVFIYYYEAYDASENYNISNYYFVTIDRSPPMVRFVDPLNGTYVGGLVNISLDVTDLYSGVNSSSVKYSLDNSVWNSTSYSVYYNATWDSSSFENNQSVTIYVNASDIIGNVNSTYVNVSIDNEAPKVFIILPTASQVLNGSAVLQMEATDQYAGPSNSTGSYFIGSIAGNLNCTDAVRMACNSRLTSSLLSDGDYTMYFYVLDKAGNRGRNSTTVTVDNLPPSVTIVNPQKNAVVSGTIQINATVTDDGIGVEAVKYIWTSSSKTGELTVMNCTGNTKSYSCSANWDTTAVSDGNYVIKINSTDKLGHLAESSVSFTVDNFAQATTSVGSGATTSAGVTVPTTTVSSTSFSQTISDMMKNSPLLKAVSDMLNADPSKRFLLVLVAAIVAAAILIIIFFREMRSKARMKQLSS